MTPAESHAEYCGYFQEPSPGQRRAVELWCWYHVTCEDYDRTVCTGGVGPGGGVLPADGWERGLISRNALAVLMAISDEAARCGVSLVEMRHGRDAVQWWSLDEMRRCAVGPRR